MALIHPSRNNAATLHAIYVDASKFFCQHDKVDPVFDRNVGHWRVVVIPAASAADDPPHIYDVVGTARYAEPFTFRRITL